jgi:hypothetical protein
MKGKIFVAWVLAALSVPVSGLASDGPGNFPDRPDRGAETVAAALPAGDTLRGPAGKSGRFLPTTRRIDRGIDDICYVYKGEMAIGFAVSYGTLTSDNSELMLLLEGIDMRGSVFTLNPAFGYFVKDNLCVGARFGYTRTEGVLGNVSLNLGAANDISMSLSNVDFRSQMTTVGAFVRSYAGVDPKGHFGLFGELELMFRMGNSHFTYGPEGGVKGTDSGNMQLRVGFSSGVAVYIFPNVCCSLSFGLGGFQFNKVSQKDAAGSVTGSRNASKLLLRLNLADIKIGLNVLL